MCVCLVVDTMALSRPFDVALFMEVWQCVMQSDNNSPFTFDGFHHTCTSSCFTRGLIKGNIYMCKLSGRLHFCGNRLCDARIECKEGTVCTLSGVLLTTQNITYTDPGFITTVDYSNRECLAKIKQPRLPKNSRLNDNKAILDMKRTNTEIFAMMIKDMSDEERKWTHTKVQICEAIYVAWKYIIKTPHYTKRKFCYKADYHALVMLHNMKRGFFDEKHKINLISSHPYVRSVLPPPNCIPRMTMGFMLERKFTKHDKFFKACIFSSSEKSVRDMQAELQRTLHQVEPPIAIKHMKVEK